MNTDYPIKISINGPVGSGRSQLLNIISYALIIADVPHKRDTATHTLEVADASLLVSASYNEVCRMAYAKIKTAESFQSAQK